MTYQPGIPTGFVDLDQDYQNIQNNFTILNNVFQVDHTPYTNTTGQKGYHTAIHLIPVSTTATNPPKNQPINGYSNTPGFGQLFSAQINDDIATDEALYFLSGGNRLTQLTRNFVPTIASSGASFLPGGLIMNWGIVSPVAAAATVTFTQQFPNNIFGVWTQPFFSGSAPGQTGTIYVRATLTNFLYSGSITVPAAVSGFYWWALGY